MGGRVTRDPASGVPTIELSLDAAAPALEEQLQDPEVAAALAGVAEDLAAARQEAAAAASEPVSEGEAASDPAEPSTEPSDAAAGTETAAGPGVEAEELLPLYLSRHQSPTKAAFAWAVERLQERTEVIDGVIVDDEGTHWNGVKVVPWADVLAIFGGSLPQAHPLTAEIADGGDLYVVLDCPKCDVAIKVKAEVDVEFKLRGREGGVAQLKAVFKTKARTHVCGQQELPLRDDVAGQTEAFPDPEPEREPTAEEIAAREEELEDTIKLLDRVEREGLVDDDSVGIPPEEDIRRWSHTDVGLAYEWAWAVVHAEPERPPLPAVLRRADPAAAAVDGEPVGCSHEGDGEPGCAVCHPETPLGEALDAGADVGTGGPDGDLLP